MFYFTFRNVYTYVCMKLMIVSGSYLPSSPWPYSSYHFSSKSASPDSPPPFVWNKAGGDQRSGYLIQGSDSLIGCLLFRGPNSRIWFPAWQVLKVDSSVSQFISFSGVDPPNKLISTHHMVLLLCKSMCWFIHLPFQFSPRKGFLSKPWTQPILPSVTLLSF